MKVLCICSHHSEADDEGFAVCQNCGRVWKWCGRGTYTNDWSMIAGPRMTATKPAKGTK